MTKSTLMHLFAKEIEKKEGGKYVVYFMAFPNEKVTISTKLTNDVKAKLQLSGLKFPLAITLRETDYFIIRENYENERGVEIYKNVCVIQDYESVAKLESKKETLESYLQNEKTNK